jgi:hypothetical protein
VNAAFINNGDNTLTDDIAGLDWLALSVSEGQAYSQAESLNLGWRYATNDEVVNLFASFFSTYSDNNVAGHFSHTAFGPTYANQDTDIAIFQSFFGATADGQTFGFYKDEDDILRMLGVYNDPISTTTAVYSDEFTDVWDAYIATPLNGYSSFLVRQSKLTSVPETASIFLFSFGLLGLLRIAKRKVPVGKPERAS